jgi:hypothetical protein
MKEKQRHEAGGESLLMERVGEVESSTAEGGSGLLH